MKRYEYFQETSENISGTDWDMLLEKHGSQGWELSSIILQDTYQLYLKNDNETNNQEKNKTMQSLYIVIFKREY